jgi:hypothetical protein
MTNGGACEIIGDFPFMLSLVEAFIGFFSRIILQCVKRIMLIRLSIWHIEAYQ